MELYGEWGILENVHVGSALGRNERLIEGENSVGVAVGDSEGVSEG